MGGPNRFEGSQDRRGCAGRRVVRHDIHPFDGLHAALCDWQVYRSTDRGKTWTEITAAEQDQAVALQDAARSRPAAAQQALDAFLTSNGGHYDGGIALGGRDRCGYGRPVFADANAVIVDPDHPSTFYAPATGDVVGTDGVYKSVDGGKTWRKASAGLVDPVVWGVVVDPSAPSTLYAATPGGIFKSSDGGTTWSMSLGGPVGRCSVVIAPSSPSTLYAWTAAGLFRTDDGGANWGARGGAIPIPFTGARIRRGFAGPGRGRQPRYRIRDDGPSVQVHQWRKLLVSSLRRDETPPAAETSSWPIRTIPPPCLPRFPEAVGC